MLKLHPRPPVIAFDGDPPGQESNVRLAMAAAAKGREVVATALPSGADPASWLADHGPAGLAAWIRKGCLGATKDEVRPALAGGIVVRHVWDTARAVAEREGVEVDRTVIMAAVIAETENSVRLLPAAATARWVASAATAAGSLAVAEAHQYLVRGVIATTPPDGGHDSDIHESWHPEVSLDEVEVGFEAATGSGGLDTLVERVVYWARRLPQGGEAAFHQAATVAIKQAGIDPTGRAALLAGALEQTTQRINPSSETRSAQMTNSSAIAMS